ncbi:hypothetical protein Bca4012_023333 [Brassica carinata]
MRYGKSTFVGMKPKKMLCEAQNVCIDDSNFRPNGPYDANRRLILSSLPSNVTSQEGLFFNGSIGQEPNRVYATGMCIPGSAPQDCSDCIKLASDGLIESCPNQTNAFTWLGDPTLCLVRYASTSFSGSGDLTPRSMVTNGGYIASNKTEFKKTWEDLVARMIDAWRLWRNVSPLELVDPGIGRNYQSNEVTRCIHIALLCVQDNPDDRPTLSTIILMLTSNTITLPLPRLPCSFPHSRNKLDQLSEGYDSSQFTGQRSVGYSGSDVTISDLEPR